NRDRESSSRVSSILEKPERQNFKDTKLNLAAATLHRVHSCPAPSDGSISNGFASTPSVTTAQLLLQKMSHLALLSLSSLLIIPRV
ncbi:hypothetical protein CEXT_508781, partial [Caerostris extrusa]